MNARSASTIVTPSSSQTSRNRSLTFASTRNVSESLYSTAPWMPFGTSALLGAGGEHRLRGQLGRRQGADVQHPHDPLVGNPDAAELADRLQHRDLAGRVLAVGEQALPDGPRLVGAQQLVERDRGLADLVLGRVLPRLGREA